MATAILKEAAGLRYNGVAVLYATGGYVPGFAGLFRPNWTINLLDTLLLADSMMISAYLIDE